MKRLSRCFYAIIIFTFTGCYDISEVYEINKDGSGSYTVDLDFTKTGELMKSMTEALDTTKEDKGYKQLIKSIDSSMDGLVNRIKLNTGISNVILTKAGDAKFTIKLNFLDISKVNVLAPKPTDAGPIEWASGNVRASWYNPYKSLPIEDGEQSAFFSFLKDFNYSLKIILPKKIKTITGNYLSKVEVNKEMFVFKNDAKSIVENHEYVDFNCKY